jgi:hypothetical protein
MQRNKLLRKTCHHINDNVEAKRQLQKQNGAAVDVNAHFPLDDSHVMPGSSCGRSQR